MTFEFNIDPLAKFTSPRYIVDVCGILPQWATSGPGETMKDSLLNNYPFYMGELTGGVVDDTGVYQYPEDEDLYPMLEIKRFDGADLKEICTIYEYAIVACKDTETGGVWITRMD